MTGMFKWMAIANWALAGLLLTLNAITIQTVCHPANPLYKILLLHLRNAVIPYAIIAHGWKCHVAAGLNHDQIQQGYLYASIRRITSFFMIPSTLMMLGPLYPATLLWLLGYMGWTTNSVDAALDNPLLDAPWIGGLGPFNPSFILPTEADWDVLEVVGLLTRITCSVNLWANTAAGGVMHLKYGKLAGGLTAEGAVPNAVGVLAIVSELPQVIAFLMYTFLTVVYEGMVVISDIWVFLLCTINRFRMRLLLM